MDSYGPFIIHYGYIYYYLGMVLDVGFASLAVFTAIACIRLIRKAFGF